MSVAKKRRKPANDLRPLSSQRLSYIALPQPYWNRRKVAALGVLSVFAAILIVIAAMNMRFVNADPLQETALPSATITAAEPTVVSVPEKPAPYDITVNASELAPPDDDSLAALAEKLPASVVMPRPSPHQAMPGDMDIAVGDEVATVKEDSAPPMGAAAYQDGIAQSLVRQGDVGQALRYEHHAAELDPSNMLYRLNLAILFDKVGDRMGAATLYQQVVAAFDDRDASLPRNVNIEDIRRRADYLVAASSR